MSNTLEGHSSFVQGEQRAWFAHPVYDSADNPSHETVHPEML